ncbi:hypothetical protein UA16_03429 [Burkholderia multivorans]|nr:hypothetical protein UA16_03429 [Burkholderia multivorans]SAJ89360.1 hypothetical protein UA14_03752 [Burkholderia multivorans]
MPLALQPATVEYVPEPSDAYAFVLPVVVRPTVPLPPLDVHDETVNCEPFVVPGTNVLALARAGSAASTTAAAIATADLFGFPRAASSSDAATQAPSASFQIERYVRFMSCYLQISTQHTWLFSVVESAVRSRQSQNDERSLWEVHFRDCKGVKNSLGRKLKDRQRIKFRHFWS